MESAIKHIKKPEANNQCGQNNFSSNQSAHIGFIDHRPESLIQRKLQSLADAHTNKQFNNELIIQRVPDGNYSDDVPAHDGMEWDTFETCNHNGENVPERVIAVMKDPENGGTPSVNPPGWQWLRTKFGRLKGQWVRFHIINAQLGGPGNDTENLVPTRTALNLNGGWRNLEDRAKDSAIDDDQWTYLEVDLEYDNDYPAGIPERIDANWGYDNGEFWVQGPGAAHLFQANPDDGDNNNYLPSGQVTQGMLRGLENCTLAEAQILKGLIDNTYDDQEEFDEIVEDEEPFEPSYGWFDTLGRIYVDEDDDLDGPYGIVVRVE